MSTLYIRLPSRAATDSATDQLALTCPFALVSQGKTIAQQGVAPLSELSNTIAAAQRIVLLLAASDVTLLRVKLPPLSPGRLKAALPNVVENRLIGDPADCVIVAGGSSDGLRTVAVMEHAWLDRLTRTLAAYGARHITALPAQLCLPYQSDQAGNVLAAINEHNTGIDLTLRLAEQEGIGLAVSIDQNETAAHEVISALCAVVSEAQVTLYVPQASVLDYKNEVGITLNKRISVFADSWSNWISGAEGATLDLTAGLGAESRPSLDMRAWRWPLVLSATLLLINIAALNLDWWHMKREADSLRATMIQLYKSAYPKETVIIDPIAQIRQKIATAKHNSGMAAPDDFTAIMAAFGEAWTSNLLVTGNADVPAIAAFEYRERSLIVRLKPGSNAPTQQMQTALNRRNLSLELSPAQSAGVVWEIRSAK